MLLIGIDVRGLLAGRVVVVLEVRRGPEPIPLIPFSLVMLLLRLLLDAGDDGMICCGA